MTQGVDVKELKEKFQSDIPATTQEKITEFITEGFFTKEDTILRTTLRGTLVLDELSAELV